MRRVRQFRTKTAVVRACALAAAAQAVVLVPQTRGEAKYTENFDIAPVDWKGLDNNTFGPYGFSNTNNTGGTSPAGEAGGTFLRTDVRNYYADRSLYGNLTDATSWGASGELFVSAPMADNDQLIGHFAAPPQGATAEEHNHGGIILRESDATHFRFMARVRGDSEQQKDGELVVVPNGQYRFAYSYDPGSRSVTAQLFPIGGGAAVATSTTPALEAGETFRGDTFGFSGGFSGSGAGQNMQLFMDGVTYSTVMPKVNQQFNSAPSDWVQLGGATFGFRNTNNTGQESGAGEAGGTFAREDVRRAYADTTIQQLNQTTPFGASGEFSWGPASNPDTEVTIAHFAQDQVDGIKLGDVHDADGGGHNVAGMQITEDTGTTFGMRARVYTADSLRLDGDRVVVPAGQYKFDYSFDPATKTLTAHLVTPDGATTYSSSLTLGPNDQLDLDAFGLTNGSNGSADPGKNYDVFIDNVNYVVGGQWGADSNANWSNSASWNGPVPNGNDQIAYFGSGISAARTVTVDAPQTIGTLIFNSPQSYTVSGGSAITLGNPTLADDGDPTTTPVPYANLIRSIQGSHTVSAPVALLGDTRVDTAAGSTVTLSNLQSSTVNISKSGAGTLAVNNVRAAGLDIQGGTVRVLPNSTATGTSRVGPLTVASGAKLDLTDNKLVTSTPAGSWNGSSYTGVAGLVATGRTPAATWSGSGIVTSQAAAQGNSALTGIGVASAADVKGISGSQTATFSGQTVTPTDAIAMYTYAGDANLDGKIDIVDYGLIDSGVRIGINGWFNGDFNYDGKIDIQDYGIIDSNVRIQGAQFSTAGAATLSGVTAVPEPTGIAVMGVAAAGAALSRRRRQRRGD